MSLTRSLFALTLALLTVVPTFIACGSSSGGSDSGVPEGGSHDATKEGKAPDGGKEAEHESAACEPGVDAGAAHLVDLSVTGKGSIALEPPFSPGVHDYYVRCAAGANTLKVSMTAGAGSTAALAKPVTSKSAISQTVSVTANENDAVVVTVAKGSTSDEYWVRCLPSDFPLLQVSKHASAGCVTPGYYLVGTLGPVAPLYAMILDSNGVPVWYLKVPNPLGPVDVDSLAKNQISYIGDPTPATFQLIDLSGKPTASLVPAGYTDDLHELRLNDSGNYVVLTYPLEGGVDLTGLNGPALPDGGRATLGSNETIQDCVALEFQADGTVVSTWSALAHFDPVKVTTFVDPATFTAKVDGGVAYDVFHCNSLDIDPANGNYLISGRSMNSMFYVEKATGKVLWKMGSAASSKDPGTAFVSVADPFVGQHDGRLVPGWNQGCQGGVGQVSVFDDETYVSLDGGVEPGARGIVYDVLVDGDGGACDGGAPKGKAGTAALAAHYPTAKQDALGGSVRPSPDGKTWIVGWGINEAANMGGLPAGIVLSEYDLAGHDLLDINTPNTTTSALSTGSYRAVKFPLTQFDLALLRQTAGIAP